MEPELSFEIVVRRKVPYVTSFLFSLLSLFILTILIIGFFFIPASYASDEMKTAYFILAFPDSLMKPLLISSIGLITVLPMYLIARFYRKATLTFLVDNIVITGNKIKINIPVKTLSKVYCMDDTSISGMSREKMTLYFQQKDLKITRVRLRHYLQVEEFMQRLLQYENVDFRIYDFNVSPDPDSED